MTWHMANNIWQIAHKGRKYLILALVAIFDNFDHFAINSIFLSVIDLKSYAKDF